MVRGKHYILWEVFYKDFGKKAKEEYKKGKFGGGGGEKESYL